MFEITGYDLSLRVFHPHLSPETIEQMLEMTARVGHAAGQPRATPRGQALEGHYRETYVTFPLVSDAGIPADDALESLAGLIEQKTRALSEIVASVDLP